MGIITVMNFSAQSCTVTRVLTVLTIKSTKIVGQEVQMYCCNMTIDNYDTFPSAPNVYRNMNKKHEDIMLMDVDLRTCVVLISSEQDPLPRVRLKTTVAHLFS